MYKTASLVPILLLNQAPKVMAGLMWQPLMPPIVYAIATTARPNASAVPITVPAFATVEQSEVQFKLTATPQPIKTSTIVPNISAKYFFILFRF